MCLLLSSLLWSLEFKCNVWSNAFIISFEIHWKCDNNCFSAWTHRKFLLWLTFVEQFHTDYGIEGVDTKDLNSVCQQLLQLSISEKKNFGNAKKGAPAKSAPAASKKKDNKKGKNDDSDDEPKGKL